MTQTGETQLDERTLLADLMQRIAISGDRAAFRVLFEHFAPRLKGYLIRLGLEAGRAEELAQEVMVTVWRKASTFDRAQGSVATWVFRIARNRRIDLFRRDRTAQLDEHDPALAPAAEAAPDVSLDADQGQIQVARALAELPPEQRDLVRAHFYEDLTHSEIAERTGLALGTVKSRLRLAFGKLRGPLQGYRESDL